MSKEAVAKAQAIKKNHPELFPQPKSLAWRITDSSLYDWNSTARFLLTQLAVLAMDEDSSYPDDAPDLYKADKIGWCWMSQAKLALKIGKSESQVQRLITRFRKDGVILYRDWRDNNMTLHAEYKVDESVIDAYQRPSQNRDVVRPRRNKEKRKPNKGSFSSKNQPGKSATAQVEDDE
jgi:hypothetical protein